MQVSTMTSADAGDGDQPEDGLTRWHRLHQQPDNEVPATVPLTAVLARTEEVAVLLTQVQATTTGFGFEISVRTRHSPSDDLYGQFMSNAGAGGQFLLGRQFPDGRRASVLDPFSGWPPKAGAPSEELPVTLTGAGGGGGGRRYDQRWWVSPLPSPGPVLMVVRWNAHDIPETITEIDGAAITEAGAAAQVLWPWEPEQASAERDASAQRPTSGWFSQV